LTELIDKYYLNQMLKIAPIVGPDSPIPNFPEAQPLEFLNRLASLDGKIREHKHSGALALGRVAGDDLRIVDDSIPYALGSLRNELKLAREAQRDSNQILFSQVGDVVMTIPSPIEGVVEEAREANRELSFYPDYININRVNDERLDALAIETNEA
jgi:hypothetical protein